VRQLRRLNQLLESMPVWAQILVAVFLTAFAVATIYGRIDPAIGRRLFSRIPTEEIRTNVGHIIQYTVIPVIVWIGFLVLLASHHGLI
jgi:hypothetical protein